MNKWSARVLFWKPRAAFYKNSFLWGVGIWIVSMTCIALAIAIAVSSR